MHKEQPMKTKSIIFSYIPSEFYPKISSNKYLPIAIFLLDFALRTG